MQLTEAESKILASMAANQETMKEDIRDIKTILDGRDIRLRLVETGLENIRGRLGLWALGLIAFSTIASAIAAYLGSVFS